MLRHLIQANCIIELVLGHLGINVDSSLGGTKADCTLHYWNICMYSTMTAWYDIVAKVIESAQLCKRWLLITILTPSRRQFVFILCSLMFCNICLLYIYKYVDIQTKTLFLIFNTIYWECPKWWAYRAHLRSAGFPVQYFVKHFRKISVLEISTYFITSIWYVHFQIIHKWKC